MTLRSSKIFISATQAASELGYRAVAVSRGRGRALLGVEGEPDGGPGGFHRRVGLGVVVHVVAA